MIWRFDFGALALGAAALVAAGVAPVSAALTEYPVAGQSVVIKDPGAGAPGTETKRGVVSFLKSATGGPPIVGDPTVSGATLSVVTDAGSQCFMLSQPGWTGSPAKGWRYEGARVPGNPAVSAVLKRSASGVLLQKVVLKARYGTIKPLLVANQADVEFRIANGVAYCGHFGGVARNDTKLFKGVKAIAPGACGISACRVCGDSVVQLGEQCDSGGVDSPTCNGVACTTSVCGDGDVNPAAGEQCDSGGADTPACNGASCTVAICGDGYVNAAAGEVCDPPNSPFGSGLPFDNGICDGCLSPSGAFIEGIAF